MKVIGIFTTTRAEYGLLSSLLDAIDKDDSLDYLLFVGGGHHLQSQGKSINEMQRHAKKIVPFDFLLSTDSDNTLTQSLGVEFFLLSDLFMKYNFEFTCVLGDRVELLPIVQTSIVYRKPIIHIHGGEITEGAIDDQIRHMITKASHIHFAICEEYARNIIQMGEESWRVHSVGALGIDSITNRGVIEIAELFKQLGLLESKPTILLTYHPVTLELTTPALTQIENVFHSLNEFDYQVVVTAPNIDQSHDDIFTIIDQQISKNENYFYVESLGIERYQSMLSYIDFVIGNSSSGILEAPFFKIPTVNIGDRQKGRIRHDSVIDTGYSIEDISEGIEEAQNMIRMNVLKEMTYKFGDGNAASRMTEIIKLSKVDFDMMRKKLEFPQ